MNVDANTTTTGAAHPETSVAAAHRALGRAGSARRRVMSAIVEEDRTDEEIQAALNMPANTQRPRRVELARLGLIQATEERRPTATGAKSIVWTATITGIIAAACAPE